MAVVIKNRQVTDIK